MFFFFFLKALLGPEAKLGELNVLQVEAMGLKGPIKTPIALLEMGKTAQIILDLSFPDPPVTFTLVKGSGPVHIVGHNLLGTYITCYNIYLCNLCAIMYSKNLMLQYVKLCLNTMHVFNGFILLSVHLIILEVSIERRAIITTGRLLTVVIRAV